MSNQNELAAAVYDTARLLPVEGSLISRDLEGTVNIAATYMPGAFQTTGYTRVLFEEADAEGILPAPPQEAPDFHEREIAGRARRKDAFLAEGKKLTIIASSVALTEVLNDDPSLTADSLRRGIGLLEAYPDTLRLGVYDPRSLSRPLRATVHTYSQATVDGHEKPLVYPYDGMAVAQPGGLGANTLLLVTDRLWTLSVKGAGALAIMRESLQEIEGMK